MKTLVEKINALFEDQHIVMLEQKDDKVYLLKEHWKYLNWRRDAPRVFVGKGEITKKDYLYLYEKIPTFRRTKF